MKIGLKKDFPDEMFRQYFSVIHQVTVYSQEMVSTN
jgi:hypothetical protein